MKPEKTKKTWERLNNWVISYFHLILGHGLDQKKQTLYSNTHITTPEVLHKTLDLFVYIEKKMETLNFNKPFITNNHKIIEQIYKQLQYESQP